jgi:hypothetical protein
VIRWCMGPRYHASSLENFHSILWNGLDTKYAKDSSLFGEGRLLTTSLLRPGAETEDEPHRNPSSPLLFSPFLLFSFSFLIRHLSLHGRFRVHELRRIGSVVGEEHNRGESGSHRWV